MDAGKNAELPTYRCPCCGKEHPITPSMIEAAVIGLLGFSRNADIEEEEAINLLRSVLSSEPG